MNTKIKMALFSVVFSFFSANALADQVEDGMSAYNQGDYETAFRLEAPLAEQGIAEAQLGLGLMYDNGYGVSQNYTEAARWYNYAASQNNQAAQYRLGLLYAKGHGVAQNFNQARELLGQATQGYDQQLAASAQKAIQTIQNQTQPIQQQSAANQLEGFAREHPIATIVGGVIGAALISDLMQGNSQQTNTQQTSKSQDDYEEERERQKQEALYQDVRCNAIRIGGSEFERTINGC